MENIYMSRGASKVVNTCLKVQPGEQILIVTELSRLSIAQALASEVYRVGAEPAVCIMEPRSQDSEEPPKEIAAAYKEQCGMEIDKKKIQLPEAIKTFGTHEVSVKLHPQVTGKLYVKVREA